MDRITAPEKLIGLQNKSLKDIEVIKCPKCGFVVGIPYI